MAEAATPRAALGALRADVDECRTAIDALREPVALEREDGALTEAQGQMRGGARRRVANAAAAAGAPDVPLADRMDRVVDEAAAASEAVNARRLEEELGRLRVEIAESRGTRDAREEAIGDALEAIARVDSGVNALRAETAAAVESVRVETLARLERMEEAPAGGAAKGAVESASLGRPSVESAVARVAAGLEPCIDAVTALAAACSDRGVRARTNAARW